MRIQEGREQSSKSLWFLYVHKKRWAVMSKHYNLHKAARNPSLLLSVQWLAQCKQPAAGYIFLTIGQIKTHIRPYVTTVSAAQSSTLFQYQPFNLRLYFMNNAKYITHWQQWLSPQFMFQPPHSTRDKLYLSMQALCDAFKGRRGAYVGIWYA